MSRRSTHLVSVLTLLLCTLASTWPIGDFSQPQLPSHADALFSVWRIAWIAHQLPNAPADLFDANIFWPQPNTLALSDAILLLGIVGAPLIWAGVHPVVVHNVLLLASFVTAGYAMMRLLHYMQVGLSAQLIGGVIFAFAPYRIGHLGHLELLWTAFLPLALLCLYRALEVPTISRGAALGATLALQGLCSIYYVAFAAIWLVPATLLAKLHVNVHWSSKHLRAAAAAGAMVAVLLGPYASSYMNVRDDVGTRPTAEIARYSATPSDYLNVPPANRVYESRPSDSHEERSLFVGSIALALAIAGLLNLRRQRLVLTFIVLGATAFDLSLGVNGISYGALRAIIPMMDGFRAPARFGVFVLLSVAVLAALGVDHLLTTMTRRGLRTAAATVLVGGLLLEYRSSPVETFAPPLRAPAVYDYIASQPPSVLVELPVPSPDSLWKVETTYQYFSIYHWQRLVNGYSGYAPPSYIRLLDALAAFPSERARSALEARDVTFVVMHEAFMEPGAYDRLLAACGNEEWFSEIRTFADAYLKRSAVCRLRRN